MSNLSTFRRFNNEQDLKAFASILEEFKIHYELENNSETVDTTFGIDEINKDFRIKLHSKDFEKANSLLEESYKDQIESINSDYYLFEFTKEELLEIITKPDEWGVFDYVLAQKLLRDKGLKITSELIKKLKKERIEELSKNVKNAGEWIYSGYFFALLGGAIGFWIGFILYNSKKTLPDGGKIYSFSKNDRLNGKIIMVIGAIMFPITLFVKFS